MAYIDATYYNEVYKGVAVSDTATLSRLIERASDIIDQTTGYKIAMSPNGLDDYSTFIQDQVKKAVAAQVEYFLLAGDSIVHGVNELQNVKIGDFSYSTDGAAQSVVSPAVLSYLRQTGLLYRGVTVCD
jgi:hypothetical protein